MATFEKRQSERGTVTWQAKVRRRGWPIQSATFATKGQAQRWARDIERQMERGVFTDQRQAERTTLHEALERYGREVTPTKKGARQELTRVRAWQKRRLSQSALANIRGADVAEYRDERMASGRSGTTVRNELTLLSQVFEMAAKEWGMEGLDNPVRRVRLPKPAKERNRRLQAGEEEKLFKACDARSSWLGQVVRLAIETAARQGELLALKWSDIDLKARVAEVRDSKNGESRQLPLSPKAIEVLASLPRSIDGRVFPLTQFWVSATFHKAAVDAGLNDLRFHDLRHEATSRLFESKKFDLMEVATITGHKELRMLRRYTHLRAEDLAARLG
jgi:integrase